MRNNLQRKSYIATVSLVVILLPLVFGATVSSQELPTGYHLELLPDSSYILVEDELDYNKLQPLLILLNCTGGTEKDIYDNIAVAESLDWLLAVARGPRNHRATMLNNLDILNLVDHVTEAYPVDTSKVFIFGFSGMGAQALYTAFTYPELFMGLISTCGHSGGLQNIDWNRAKHLCVYLITRQEDWNRQHNENMARLFDSRRIRYRLEITPGEHKEGPPEECFEACKWLNAISNMPWK